MIVTGSGLYYEYCLHRDIAEKASGGRQYLAGRSAITWDNIVETHRVAWNALAITLTDLSTGSEDVQAKLAFLKYGRHLPTCHTGQPCQCGFDSVATELGIERV